MLKVIRNRAIENPKFFRGIMGILAVTFMISLGWWGGAEGDKQRRNIAEIGEDSISFEEYNRAYKNASRFYRQVMKTPIEEKVLRQQVLDQMIDQKLWLQEAIRINLQVTDNELLEAIVKLPGFQENGKFSPGRYRKILSLEKMTPEQFERQQRDEMLIDKAKDLIRASAALTPLETEEIEKLAQKDQDQERLNRLNRKREKAVHAYGLALKKKSVVSIKNELF